MREKEAVDSEVVSLRSKVSSVSEEKVALSSELSKSNDMTQQMLKDKFKLESEAASLKKKLDESVAHIKEAAKAISEVNSKYVLAQLENTKLQKRLAEVETAHAATIASISTQAASYRGSDHDVGSDDDSLGMGADIHVSATNSLDEVESQNMVKEVSELQSKLSLMKEKEAQMRKELSQEHEQNKLLLDALNKALSNEAADQQVKEKVVLLERENAQLKMQLNKMLI
jgi:hypothetical protein